MEYRDGSDNSLDLSTAKDYIDHIDFSNIINKMVLHQGWRKRDAIAVSEQYRHFLWLHKKYGQKHTLPPSEEIDKFWHNHILDTKQYRNDCQAIFGRYLDHYPYLGIDGKTNRHDLNRYFAVTQQLYEKEIGEPLVNIIVTGFRGLLIRCLEKMDHLLSKQAQRLKRIIHHPHS